MATQQMTATRFSGRRCCVWGLVVALAASLCACTQRPSAAIGSCTFSGILQQDRGGGPYTLDLLLVLDDSADMAAEHVALAAQLPHILDVLTRGSVTDPDLDELRRFPAPHSVHLGVVDADMGSGGFLAPTCVEPNFGDDGILRDSASSGCDSSVLPFLEFLHADAVATVLAAASCLSSVGTSGCSFQQPLDATLKALTPSTSSLTFAAGTRGHGDVENAGFLRFPTVLAVLLVTNGDDCSASDPDIFNSSSPRYSGDLNLRCFQFPEALHPVSRYVDGLLALRPGSPELLVFGALVGMPTDLAPEVDEPDFAALLADPRMQPTYDPSAPGGLAASCDVPDGGHATPPARIVQVAQGLFDANANVALGSLCQRDYQRPIDRFLARIADVFGHKCQPRALPRTSLDDVECTVSDVLPAEGEFTHCTQLADAGRSLLRTEDDYDGMAHEVCAVRQLHTTRATTEPPAGVGWYYDDFSARTDRWCGDQRADNGTQGQRIVFTPGAVPGNGVTVRIECLARASGASAEPGVVGPGTPCGAAYIDCSRSDVPDLFCAESTNTCVVACSEDRACRDHGLPGQRCVGGTGESCAASGASEGPCFCTNPTCDEM